MNTIIFYHIRIQDFKVIKKNRLRLLLYHDVGRANSPKIRGSIGDLRCQIGTSNYRIFLCSKGIGRL